MPNRILVRILVAILIFVFVVHGWWFVALPIVFVATWHYPYFIEAIMAGLVYDSLFGFIPEMGISSYYGIILSILAVILVSVAKKFVRK